jgi:D-arabinose 1-dehydrogenase-like Zn-dependent alcohol dehydrogenase
MRAVQVSSPNGPFELIEREIPVPGTRQVRIKVQACGICHSDSLTKMGAWPSGTATDSEDTLDFSVLSRIRPMIESYPLDRASEAYERLMSGKARFRVVLTMEAR